MNFLGHWWLTPPNEPQILAGNFMGDSIKGRSYLNYPQPIQTGILLHRQIDFFTDSHLSTKSMRAILRPFCGRFGWLAVDVLYDHFLSRNWANFSELALQTFIFECVESLYLQKPFFPDSLGVFFEKLVEQNWAASYADQTKLGLILLQMGKRTNFEPESKALVENLNQILFQTETAALTFLHEIKANFDSQRI